MMNEPTSIYRFYKTTCQRVLCAYTILNSACAFIITNDKSNKIVLWIGKTCSIEDKRMAEQYAILYKRQMPENGKIQVIVEGFETGIGIDYLSQILWMTIDRYVEESIARQNSVVPPNSPKILYSLLFDSSKGSSASAEYSSIFYDKTTKVSKICTVIPDADGKVPTLNFPGKTYASAYILCVGDQLDLWVSDVCTNKQLNIAKNITQSMQQEKLSGIKVQKKLEPVLFGCNIRYSKENLERCFFSSNFSNKTCFSSKIQLHEATCIEDPVTLEETVSLEKTISDPIVQTWNRVTREIGIWSFVDSFSTLSSSNNSDITRNDSFNEKQKYNDESYSEMETKENK